MSPRRCSSDDDCLGFLIGDAGGRKLALGEGALQLLTALARVGAVFLLEVASDPDGLERMLTNLIVNALRYGEPRCAFAWTARGSSSRTAAAASTRA